MTEIDKFKESKELLSEELENAKIILKTERSQDMGEERKRIKKAGDIRKRIVKIRTGAKKIHTEEKKFYLEKGKEIDSMFNEIKDGAVEFETRLKEIEDYEENLEKERNEKKAEERKAILLKYDCVLEENILNSLDEDTFQLFLGKAKEDFEKKKSELLKIKEAFEKQEIKNREDEERNKKVAEENERNAKKIQKEAEESLRKKEEEERKEKEKNEIVGKLASDKGLLDFMEKNKIDKEEVKDKKIIVRKVGETIKFYKLFAEYNVD